MRATFKLLNSYFWKTIYGPVITFGLPLLLLAILGHIMRIQYVYPGIIAMSLLFIGIFALPLAIMELKSSSLFKYIGASPVDTKRFSAAAIGYYVFIAIIAAVVIMCGTMVFYSHEVFPKAGFKYGILGGIFNTAIGALSFYVATGIHLIVVIAFGLVIATFSKTPQQALTIAFCIIVPSIFLSGMILSVDIIAQSNVMQWLSRFIPFRYTTGNIVISSTSIDQLGDVLTLLTPQEKAIIFAKAAHDGANGLQSDGSILWRFSQEQVDAMTAYLINLNVPVNPQINELVDKQITIRTSLDLFDFISKYVKDGSAIAKQTVPFMNDSQELLLKLVMFKEMQNGALELLPSSDNNIFDWVRPWGVRRIPVIDQITNFIRIYFTGTDPNNPGGDVSRFNKLWDSIRANDYTWLNLFLKQNNTLYTIPDRVLNMVIPVVATVGSLWYVSKNFKWSAR